MSIVHIPRKVQDVIMRNLCDINFYKKADIMQDFHICISVPLRGLE